MPDFGPFARWPDPRVYDLIAGYRWGDFQRSLLLGQRSWDRSEMSRGEQKAYEAVDTCLTERGFRIARSPEHTRDVVTITLEGLPPEEVMLPTLIAQWGLTFHRIRILALEGPVDTIGQVPIFRATVFGNIEGAKGARSIGLQRDVYVVGRLGVHRVERVGPEGRMVADQHCPLRPERARFRTTLRRARNTAAQVDALLPEWEVYTARIAAREKAVEEARLEAERHEGEDDPGVDNFAA